MPQKAVNSKLNMDLKATETKQGKKNPLKAAPVAEKIH